MKKCDNSLDFAIIDKKFPTNEKCFEKLKRTRWKNGFRCPRCSCKEKWDIAQNKYKCRNCGYQPSVTAGTIFQRTHLEMTKWFKAIYYVNIRKEKATGVELQTLLDISYDTASSVLKKIKPMIYCASDKKLLWNNNKLKGTVEIDRAEIKLGDRIKNIYIAVENNSGAIGRIRISEYKRDYNEEVYIRKLISIFIDDKATVRCAYFGVSCPLAKKVGEDFIKWCKGKENKKLNDIYSYYCRMINTYKTKVTFDEILRNICSCKIPPYYDSLIKK